MQRIEPERLGEVGHGFIAVVLTQQRQRQVKVGFGIIGIQSQCLPVVPDRCLRHPCRDNLHRHQLWHVHRARHQLCFGRHRHVRLDRQRPFIRVEALLACHFGCTPHAQRGWRCKQRNLRPLQDDECRDALGPLDTRPDQSVRPVRSADLYEPVRPCAEATVFPLPRAVVPPELGTVVLCASSWQASQWALGFRTHFTLYRSTKPVT